MAQCSQTAFEFIQGAYGPMIAVLCTDDAEIVCQKNNLNFVELIRPFSQLTSEAHIRDPLNLTHPVKGWKLRFVELSAPTPSKDVVTQLLNDVVLRVQGPDRAGAASIEEQMKASTPWFEAFRDCFIQVVKPSDHEFIRHFLGCLFVVSSNNTDPLNAFQSLSSALDSQQPSDSIHSKWFSTNIFKYYLLIHDVTDGVQNKAEGVYQSMKSYYGSSICHLLMINSRSAEQHSPNLPDPWSQFIISTSKDTLEMVHDKTTTEVAVEPEEEDQVIIDENFDPLIAVQNSNENSAPVLIGPLSFENDVEKKIPSKHLDQNNVDGRKPVSHGIKGTRQFSGGLLSQAGSNSGQHGACLTLSDHDRIRIFIHELAIRGLIPFIERAMRYLYDQITARKGLHKSFFHATKKWFGGGKPVGQTNASLVPGIIYDSDSPELLWRKLGDLAFLVQNYELAYNSYHTAKRDFNTNHAWLYFAGALEMASISAFMTGGQRQYPSHYMETSISTYVDACRQHQFATRATLFGVEAFKSQGMYSKAAFALLKMTGEESDLLSAILLEQAAHCFLRTQPPRIRKYAFNMILAGHRYSKAAQRKHALRCYKHSLFIYNNKSWRMAEDHINFIIGRQSFNLRQLEDALSAFKELLLGESLQTSEQQASYLREFLFVFQQLCKLKQTTSSPASLPSLPLPKLQTNSAKIIFAYNPSASPPASPENKDTVKPLREQVLVNNPFEQAKTSEEVHVVGLHSFEDLQQSVESTKWEQIELETYERVNQIQATPNFRHFTPCLTNTTNNALKPQSIVNENIGVEVILENELKIPLTLSNMALLWKFVSEGEDEEKCVQNEFEVNDDCVRTEIIQEFSISGSEKKPARLSVTPLRTGNLQITGIKYSLSSVTLSGPVDYINTKSADHPAVSAVSVLGKLDIGVRGQRLNSTKAERSSVMYGEDNRLNIVVVKPMPRLQVTFCRFPSTLLCGELQKVKVELSNVGEGPLNKLHLASTNPNLFALDVANSNNEDIKIPDFQKKLLSRSLKRVAKIFLTDGCLNAGDKIEYITWVQGRRKSGISNEELLFYYESTDENPSMSHRTVRHRSTMKTSKSLAIRATAKRCKVTSHEEGQKDIEENSELVVTLEVENLSLSHAQFRTFYVLQVSCVSKKWILKPLSHQKEDGMIIINQGETVLTHFKAVRRRQASDLNISNLSFADKETDISCLPYWEFFRRSNAWKELNEFEERTDSTMSVDLALVALWESSYIDSQMSKHTVHGQSEVAIVTLAESLSAPVFAQPAKKRSLISSDVSTSGNTELYVKYTVKGPGMITHDFEKQRFCEVVVTVTLHNCSQFNVKAFVEMLADFLEIETVDSSVQVEDKTKKDKSVSSSNPSYSLQYNNSFLWTGRRSKQIALQPSQTMNLKFSARIFRTGVFNLNHCQVLAGTDTKGENTLMVTQKSPPACLLVVKHFKEEGTTSESLSQEGMMGLFDYEAVQR